MPLPSTGQPISLGQVNSETLRPFTQRLDMNDPTLRLVFNKTIDQSRISMSDGWGTSYYYSGEFNFTGTYNDDFIVPYYYAMEVWLYGAGGGGGAGYSGDHGVAGTGFGNSGSTANPSSFGTYLIANGGGGGTRGGRCSGFAWSCDGQWGGNGTASGGSTNTTGGGKSGGNGGPPANIGNSGGNGGAGGFTYMKWYFNSGGPTYNTKIRISLANGGAGGLDNLGYGICQGYSGCNGTPAAIRILFTRP